MSLLNLIVPGTSIDDATQLMAADTLIRRFVVGYEELLRMDATSPAQVDNLREYARSALADAARAGL